MTTIAKTWSRGSGSSDQRRQLMLLAVLGVVLALLLVWHVPKLLRGSGSSSEATTTAASPIAQASAVARASTAAQASAAGPAPVATAVQTAGAVASSSSAAARTELRIKHHPARDPFAPLAGNEPAATTATPAATPAPTVSTPAAQPAAPAPTTPLQVIPAPKVAPTAAVLVTNGRRQVIGLHEEFTLGGTTFQLVSVDPKQITIAVAGASFAGGTKKITLDRAKQVSFENAATYVRYSIVFRQATNETPTTTATAAPSASAVGTPKAEVAP